MNQLLNQKNYATIVKKITDNAGVKQVLAKSNDLAVKKIAPSIYKQGKERGRIEGALGAIAIGTLVVGTYVGVRKYLENKMYEPRSAEEEAIIEHELDEAVTSFKEAFHEATDE